MQRVTWRERFSLGLPLLPIAGGADGTIAVDEGVADKLVDTEQLVVGVNTVQRERVQVTGTAATAIATVATTAPAAGDFGLHVRTQQGHASGTPMFTDPIDRALRDEGKVDIAGFDVALPTGTNRIGHMAGSGTATLANVAASAASVTLQASNAARLGLVIVNDSTGADLYVKLGATASVTSYTYYLPRGINGQLSILELPLPVYTGIVDGIWSSASGNARMTELT